MNSHSTSNKLQTLFNLFKSGTLSKEEYDLLKSEITKEHVNQPSREVKQTPFNTEKLSVPQPASPKDAKHSTTSKPDQLRDLLELYRSGALKKEEFELLKSQLTKESVTQLPKGIKQTQPIADKASFTRSAPKDDKPPVSIISQPNQPNDLLELFQSGAISQVEYDLLKSQITKELVNQLPNDIKKTQPHTNKPLFNQLVPKEANPTTTSNLDQLNDLLELLRSGAINKEEYDLVKSKLEKATETQLPKEVKQTQPIANKLSPPIPASTKDTKHSFSNISQPYQQNDLLDLFRSGAINKEEYDLLKPQVTKEHIAQTALEIKQTQPIAENAFPKPDPPKDAKPATTSRTELVSDLLDLFQ